MTTNIYHAQLKDQHKCGCLKVFYCGKFFHQQLMNVIVLMEIEKAELNKLKWHQKIKMIELGGYHLGDGRYLCFSKQSISLANLIVVIGFFLSVAASISFRSYWLYLLFIALYVLTRYLLVKKASISLYSSNPHHESRIAYTLLIIFMILVLCIF